MGWCIRVSGCLVMMFAAAACGEVGDVPPVQVDPAISGGSEQAEDSSTQRARTVDGDRPPRDDGPDARRVEAPPAEGGERTSTSATDRPRTRPAAGEGAAGGIWVVDSAGEGVGVLVRRGSDDNLVYRAIYDLVTVYHPGSGLFYEITMTDAQVRRPSTTFFSTASCDNPVGISYGGCAECRSGPGTALLHDGTWYQVTAGVTFEVTTAGSTLGSGLQDACSSHHTDSAKIFPVTEVNGPTPPTSFVAPLHITWQ